MCKVMEFLSTDKILVGKTVGTLRPLPHFSDKQRKRPRFLSEPEAFTSLIILCHIHQPRSLRLLDAPGL